jgi:threonine/homoserine/homoserine lactone efflux protein
MIAPQMWILIVGFAVPMIISPGPGNTIFAMAGGRFGIRGTLPFWVGFETANLLWCFVYGFGLSRLVLEHPGLAAALKWAGIAYTLYLAYSFLQRSPLETTSTVRPLSVTDGFVSVCLNPKIHSMIFVMFSQFLSPHLGRYQQVVQISIVFTMLCIVCHFPWIYGGRLVFERIKSERAMKAQGYVFAAAMVLVAAFVAFAT